MLNPRLLRKLDLLIIIGNQKEIKCGQKGHWKKDCPKLKGQSGNFSTTLIESCFLADFANSWWIDSRVTYHICNSLQGFKVIRSLNEGCC